MNNSKIKEFIKNNTTTTFNDLKVIIDEMEQKNLSGFSIINKGMPLEFLFNTIVKPYIQKIEIDGKLHEIVKTTRYSDKSNKIVLSHDGLFMRIILIESKTKKYKY